MHFKVREEGRIVTKAAYVALGINGEGYKDIPGIWIGENEGAKFWLKVCSELKNRDVQDILIACIDGLNGFPDAIRAVFPQTRIQLCVIHQIRNSIKYVSYKDQKAFLSDLKKVYGKFSGLVSFFAILFPTYAKCCLETVYYRLVEKESTPITYW